MGPRVMDAGQPRAGVGIRPSNLSAEPASEPRSRTEYTTAVAQRGLDARLLVLAARRLRLAPGVLGGRPAQLDLDARALRLDTRRVSVRTGILGPARGQPRH